LCFSALRFSAHDFYHGTFSEFKDLLRSYPSSRLAKYQEYYALKSSMLVKIAAERIIEQEKVSKQLSLQSKEVKRNFAVAQAANLDLEKKVAELAETLKHCQDEKKAAEEALDQSKKRYRKTTEDT
jgi:predicted metallo-beta-lactamase superfamily hydrolase